MFKRLGNSIKRIIKENNQYLSAELEVVKESKEGIAALKEYAEKETPSLEDAIFTLANTFENIENCRQDKVTHLKEKFIAPLEELLDGFIAREQEIKEAEDAQKNIEKAKKTLEKEKLKHSKGKLDKTTQAKANLNAAVERSRKEQEDVKDATEAFNKKKLETMQSILTNLVSVEQEYHEKILGLIGTVKEKAEAIKIEEESVVEIVIPEINLDDEEEDD